MKKQTTASYEDLRSLLQRIYKNTKIESVLDVSWANYSVELYDELRDILLETKEENNE